MAMFAQILYHTVFSTKDRRPCLDAARREDLLRYVWGLVKGHEGHLYRINAVEDHIHIFSDLHPTVCLGDFVKDIKVASSAWIKKERVFRGFEHWQEGYGAFTYAFEDKDSVIEYIKRQGEHHRKVSFEEELRAMLKKAGVEFDERYLF